MDEILGKSDTGADEYNIENVTVISFFVTCCTIPEIVALIPIANWSPIQTTDAIFTIGFLPLRKYVMCCFSFSNIVYFCLLLFIFVFPILKLSIRIY